MGFFDMGSLSSLFGGGADSFNYPSSAGTSGSGFFGAGMPSSSQMFGGNSGFDLGSLMGGGGSGNSWAPGGSFGTGSMGGSMGGMGSMSPAGSPSSSYSKTNLSNYGLGMNQIGTPGANPGGTTPGAIASTGASNTTGANAPSGNNNPQTNWLSTLLNKMNPNWQQTNPGETQNASNPMTNMFSKMLPSAGMMGLASMIPNSSTPKMPASFDQFMQQIQQGGNPAMQGANNWYQGILNGTNQGPANAAVQSIDLNYQEQLRNLYAQYKSLRPGTDPSTDSTFQRDLANLNTQYQQQRSNALAQVQTGAAQGAAGIGSDLMTAGATGIGAQIARQGSQWANQQNQTATLRNALMGLFGGMAGNQGTLGILSQLFGGGNKNG